MSQENVELWRAAIEDLRRRLLRGGTEGVRSHFPGEELWDPEIEWDASEIAAAPDIGGVYRGREAVRRWWQEWLAAWDVIEFEYELVDSGDSVVMLLDQRMRGRSSGINVPGGKYAQVATFRDGLMSAGRSTRASR